ncbi:hypothetical protein [Kitasatospora griseola]|uniref:hypothetical protein n=1 Tax=Kitasatospora griseola TaxID=2064 RepID=UPI00166FA611|nr:hypothetical protein [Kitasatospora griseola]
MSSRGSAGWRVLAAAALLAVLAPVLTVYAVRTHDELAWQLCRRLGTRPARVWAAAFGAPVASVAAAVGAVRLAVKAERQPGLTVAAVVLASVLAPLLLVEASTAVKLLFVDDSGGDACGP